MHELDTALAMDNEFLTTANVQLVALDTYKSTVCWEIQLSFYFDMSAMFNTVLSVERLWLFGVS